MFLLRTAFWLAIIIMILPTDAKNRQYLVNAAQTAFTDLSSFCDRNPGVCKESKVAFNDFSEKAQFGAQLVMGMMSPSADHATAVIPAKASTNTLNAADLKPLWETPTYEYGS